MTWHTRHQIVVDSQWTCLRKPSRKLQQRLERSAACNVEIHIHTTKVVQYEVLECINTLDGMFVCIVCWDKPGIFGLDEGVRFGFVPDADLEGRIEL